jgi:hypothetical protein
MWLKMLGIAWSLFVYLYCYRAKIVVPFPLIIGQIIGVFPLGNAHRIVFKFLLCRSAFHSSCTNDSVREFFADFLLFGPHRLLTEDLRCANKECALQVRCTCSVNIRYWKNRLIFSQKRKSNVYRITACSK